ncbi:phage holin family protein [Thalassospira xiamenensis]|uniref:phage holin family protein n=1 Tax=Thalassospira xiamenensis TaxID=220697 RepID=UPI000DEDF7D0|nr:phage holin family protein [Thalassospira xiamenensis]
MIIRVVMINHLNQRKRPALGRFFYASGGEMQENLPPSFSIDSVVDLIKANGLLVSFAVLVRMLWHQRLVRLGQRRFWSWDLLWEIPMAVMCAGVGSGVASYFNLEGSQTVACIGVCSWLGPVGSQAILDRVLTVYVKGQTK